MKLKTRDAWDIGLHTRTAGAGGAAREGRLETAPGFGQSDPPDRDDRDRAGGLALSAGLRLRAAVHPARLDPDAVGTGIVPRLRPALGESLPDLAQSRPFGDDVRG